MFTSTHNHTTLNQQRVIQENAFLNTMKFEKIMIEPLINVSFKINTVKNTLN